MEQQAQQQQQQQQQQESGVQSVLERVLGRVMGLRGIVVSDKDGVPLCVASQPGEDRAALLVSAATPSYGACAEQLGKMGMGRCATATTLGEAAAVVYVNASPLVAALVAEPDANVGAMLALAPLVAAALGPLAAAVETSSQ
eukprot:m51a1_g6090 putative ragulator complex protein lamtor3 homolog (142) ;mRNA; f:34223-34862